MKPMATTGTQVLEAVVELHEQEQIATRELVAEKTGLKLSVVDDRLGALVEEGLLLRVQRGVFAPAPQYGPARLISRTILPGGLSKIEVGDEVLTLTPKECRMLGELMAGAATQAAAIVANHHAHQWAAGLELEIARLKKQLAREQANALDGDEKKRQERGRARLDMARQKSMGF